MTNHDSDSRELVELIDGAWSPPGVDADAFDARLHGRLRARKRRRATLAGAAVAALVLVVASHLIGAPEPAQDAIVQAPSEFAPMVASAEPASVPAFFAGALGGDSYGIPGSHGAVDTLFLQPLDQEL